MKKRTRPYLLIQGPQGKTRVEIIPQIPSISEARKLNSHFFGQLAPYLKQHLRNEHTYWAIYDRYFLDVALPYTEMSSVLNLLENIISVEGHGLNKIQANLIQAWCESKNIKFDKKKFRPKLKSLIQETFLSVCSIMSYLLLSIIHRKGNPPIGIWTGDLLSQDSDFDLRLGNFYHYMRAAQVPYIEFVRSSSISVRETLKNFLKRKRPIIYYECPVHLLTEFKNLFFSRPLERIFTEDKDQFFYQASLAYLPFLRSLESLLPFYTVALKRLNLRSILVWFFSSRTAILIWAAKASGIKTVGIMHGLCHINYMGHEYIPEYVGPAIGPDVYGVWGPYWMAEFSKQARIYPPNGIKLSGPLRPLHQVNQTTSKFKRNVDKFNLLFIAEQSLNVEEALPYLHALLDTIEFTVTLKIRPFGKDKFLEDLRKKSPDILHKLRLDHRPIHKSLLEANVVVGTHSTALLEASAFGVPMIFYHTQKWGDFFGIKGLKAPWSIYADSPLELCRIVRDVIQRSSDKDTLLFCENLNQQFFGKGDGAKWLTQECFGQ